MNELILLIKKAVSLNGTKIGNQIEIPIWPIQVQRWIIHSDAQLQNPDLDQMKQNLSWLELISFKKLLSLGCKQNHF